VSTRDKSFTVNIIPRDATRKRRQLRITGKRLVLFRVILFLCIASIAGSIVILALGITGMSTTAQLARRNRLLSDSLSVSLELNRRLDSIEEELVEIRHTRHVIENLATAGAPMEEPE
jgi:hypothetical protein